MLRLKYKRIVTEDSSTFSPMRDTTGGLRDDGVDGLLSSKAAERMLASYFLIYKTAYTY